MSDKCNCGETVGNYYIANCGKHARPKSDPDQITVTLSREECGLIEEGMNKFIRSAETCWPTREQAEGVINKIRSQAGLEDNDD
jgi:hypothetical protein